MKNKKIYKNRSIQSLMINTCKKSPLNRIKILTQQTNRLFSLSILGNGDKVGVIMVMTTMEILTIKIIMIKDSLIFLTLLLIHLNHTMSIKCMVMFPILPFMVIILIICMDFTKIKDSCTHLLLTCSLLNIIQYSVPSPTTNKMFKKHKIKTNGEVTRKEKGIVDATGGKIKINKKVIVKKNAIEDIKISIVMKNSRSMLRK